MDFLKLRLSTSLDPVKLPISGKTIFIKRDDLIHPIVSGNKYRKCLGFIQYFKDNKFKSMISVGNLNSNHVHALSYICSQVGIDLKVYLYGNMNVWKSPVVCDLEKWGISFSIIDRKDIDLIEFYKDQVLFVPEGGASSLAKKGIAELANEISNSIQQENYNVCLATGTGTTAKYLYECLPSGVEIYFSTPVRKMITSLQQNNRIHQLPPILRNRFGGYSEICNDYILLFYKVNSILLDPIYTGRLVYELDHYIANKNNDSTYVIIHSGGLQGWRFYSIRYPEIKKHPLNAIIKTFVFTN